MNNDQPPKKGLQEIAERHFGPGTLETELEDMEKRLTDEELNKHLEKFIEREGLDRREFYAFVTALCDVFLNGEEATTAVQKAFSALEPEGKGKRELLAKLGKEIPVNTYQEVREVKKAIAEGRSRLNWDEVKGDTALCHSSPKDPNFEVRLEGNKLLQYWDLSPSYDALWGFVDTFELDAAVCLDLCLHIALKDDRAPIETDELIRGLGWDPRTTEQRNEMRRKIWSWVTAFANMSVYGNRPGKPERWKDKMTGKTLDLRSRGPLIMISSTSLPEGQLTLDGSDAPIKFTLAPGDWLARFRGNHQVLATLGNTWKIAAIPGGKPSGAWARAYAQALHQSWREKAAYDSPNFTREGLHLAYPSQPLLCDVLDGRNPCRAIEYDQDAWTILKEAGIIATDPKSLTFTPKTRKGWKDDFRKEKLTVRPGPDIEAELAAIRPALNPRERKK